MKLPPTAIENFLKSILHLFLLVIRMTNLIEYLTLFVNKQELITRLLQRYVMFCYIKTILQSKLKSEVL